jgi:hypothetical protein
MRIDQWEGDLLQMGFRLRIAELKTVGDLVLPRQEGVGVELGEVNGMGS